jgi:hypothetical protein
LAAGKDVAEYGKAEGPFYRARGGGIRLVKGRQFDGFHGVSFVKRNKWGGEPNKWPFERR